MRIHHLNCMTFHTVLSGVAHCLLVEAGDSLLLLDTGLGLADCIHPTAAVRRFAALIGAPRQADETAVRQFVRLGFAPQDIRHIVMTHLHLDHAGLPLGRGPRIRSRIRGSDEPPAVLPARVLRIQSSAVGARAAMAGPRADLRAVVRTDKRAGVAGPPG